ncbi:AraC family transcriptional regulator [Paenibacillus sp. 598K]|uniref:AraC family transcriptional regulator n=1 Tax=Paenibacillus sp. 598K TaxID=1117987 RepID=UPI000FFA2AF4|nr:AraC family transcriptional regulator [Paenibacillus sp. 598K]GBF71804.1 AraC family transcriptional regulator [Paenibacillus sp. 598K]
MDIALLNNISPLVRIVKIIKSWVLSGEWIDYDNVYTYIEQGTADFIIGGVKYTVAEGDAVLIPPFTHHFINVTSEEPLIQYIFHFDLHYRQERSHWKRVGIVHEEQRKKWPEELQLAGLFPVVHLQHSERFDLKRAFLVMHKEFRDKRLGYELIAKSMTIHLLAIFMRNRQPEEDNEQGKVTKGWAVIKKSIDYIHKHYADPNLDNDRISLESGVSTSHLSFIYKQQLGVTIHSYLVHVRIEQSKRLILHGNDTLTNISEKVGYASIHQFSKAFKKVAGITPSRFIATYAKELREADH